MADQDHPPGTSAKLVHLRPRRPCSQCGKPSVHKYHPFCSARCADIDLHKWLGGHYAIPATEPPDFEDAAAAEAGSDEEN